MNDEWKSVNDVAALIGVSARAIYLRIKSATTPLASMKRAGQTCVRANEAYDNFDQHGRRPPGLRKPPGYVQAAGPLQTDAIVDPFDPEIRAALAVDVEAIDLHALVVQLTTIGASDSKIRAVSTAANAIQKRRADAVRAGKSLPPEDVTKMLRNHADLVIDEIDGSAMRQAGELLRLFREKFNMDVKRPDAAQIVAAYLLEAGNVLIARIRQRVDDDIRGVQMLEFSPVAGGPQS